MRRCIPCVLNINFRIVLYFSAIVCFVFFIAFYVDRPETQTPTKTRASPQQRLMTAEQLTESLEINQSTFLNTDRFPQVSEFELSPRFTKFDNEQTRVIGFTNQSHRVVPNSSKKVIYLATPYFGEWNARHYYNLHLGDTTFRRYSCPTSNCHVTKDPSDQQKADAVIFHLRDLEVYSLPKQHTPEQVWILYSMEPPWLEVTDLRKFKGVFNWTMSYRRGSDVLMRYGFVGRRPTSNVALNVKSNVALNVESNVALNVESNVELNVESNVKSKRGKKKADRGVWFVSNCRTDSNREEYVGRLKKVFPIDVYGGCGEEFCRPAEAAKCYSKLETRYKFYLAFENAVCRDYVTEKLFNALEFNMVPVVLGGADYSSLVPEGSIISAMDFASPEDLGRYLWQVSRNDSLYRSYFSWKATYRSYIQPWMCDLCAKLHEGSSAEKPLDLEDWWNEGYSCKRWLNSSFRVPEESVFPAYHIKLFD